MKYAIAVLLTLVLALPVAADVVSLDAEAAARLALQASGRSSAAAARVAAAGERVGAADASRLPVVSLESSVAGRSSVPELALPEEIPGLGGIVLFPDIRTTARAGVAMAQPLWTGGAVSANRSATRHDEQAVRADAARIALDLELEARSTFWSAAASAGALDAARAEQQRAERLLEDAGALRAAGMAIRADELAAEARVAAARVRLIEAEAEAANRRAELASLVGLPEETDIELADRVGGLPPAPPPQHELVTESLASRPELAALASRRDALASRSVALAAPGRPQLSLLARWDVARPNERYLPLADEWNSGWSVGVQAGWRLFDGNRTGAAVAGADAERTALEADLAELGRRVELEVVNARRTLDAVLAAHAAAVAAVDVAAAREVDSSDRYAAGVATVSEVLDAQSELAEAELALVRARSRAWLADARLRRAVGR